MITPSRIYKPDKCWNLDFDGSNDAVNLGNITQLNELSALTIMLWMMPKSYGDFKALIWSRSTTPSIGESIEIFTGSAAGNGQRTLEFRVRNGALSGAAYSPANLITTNTWGCIAMVFDGAGAQNADRMKLYYDGVLKSLTFTTDIPTTTGTTAANIYIGGGVSWASYYWPGRIANVVFTNRALPQKEIQYWMNRYLTGRENGLIAYYPFLDGSGSTLKDWSNNKIDGTITGATWTKGS